MAVSCEWVRFKFRGTYYAYRVGSDTFWFVPASGWGAYWKHVPKNAKFESMMDCSKCGPEEANYRARGRKPQLTVAEIATMPDHPAFTHESVAKYRAIASK